MTLTYRLQKGSALTYGELDQNFFALDARLQRLEEGTEHINHTPPHIRLDGLDWVFEDQSGREMARVGVPLPKFNPRGPWQCDHAYAPFDLVAYKGVIYLCVQSHVSTDFDQQKDAFQLLINHSLSPRGDQSSLESSRTEQNHHTVPIYSVTSEPRPTTGALIIGVDASGRQSLKIGMNKSWQTISTKAPRSSVAQSSRELQNDETTPS